jgi:hypothetical protein
MDGIIKSRARFWARVGVRASGWPGAIRAACEPMVRAGCVSHRYEERCVELIHENGPYIVLAPGRGRRLRHRHPCPYGDAAYPTTSGARTAGLSSLTGVYVWNLLLTRLADMAATKSVSLPIFTSSNVAGGAERNTELIKHYRAKVHAL